jgi:hypothetical protein
VAATAISPIQPLINVNHYDTIRSNTDKAFLYEEVFMGKNYG